MGTLHVKFLMQNVINIPNYFLQ